MDFESAAPSAVRSIKQRDLLNTWLRLRGEFGAYPPISEYRPARLEEEKKELIYYIVERQQDDFRFIINSNGSTAAQAYGTSNNNNIGTDLWDYLRPNMREWVLPLYHECAVRERPVYSISVVEDTDGHSVAYERLLLPFFLDGKVHQIIASLKAISEDGKFEINNLLRNRDTLPVYRVRALIDRELSAHNAVRDSQNRAMEAILNSKNDVIEI